MGVFLDYTSNLFANLNKTPTNLLQTGTSFIPHVVVVNSIIVCNLIEQPIRFNLKKQRTDVGSTTIFYVKDKEIAPYSSVDIIKNYGFEIYLHYNLTPLITDILLCFSNTAVQKFDCEITYSILNETPLAL